MADWLLGNDTKQTAETALEEMSVETTAECTAVCLVVCLSICLSVCMCVCMSVCLCVSSLSGGIHLYRGGVLLSAWLAMQYGACPSVQWLARQRSSLCQEDWRVDKCPWSAAHALSLSVCYRADNGSQFVTHQSADPWPAWPMTQSQSETMAWVDHDYLRIMMSSRLLPSILCNPQLTLWVTGCY